MQGCEINNMRAIIIEKKGKNTALENMENAVFLAWVRGYRAGRKRQAAELWLQYTQQVKDILGTEQPYEVQEFP